MFFTVAKTGKHHESWTLMSLSAAKTGTHHEHQLDSDVPQRSQKQARIMSIRLTLMSLIAATTGTHHEHQLDSDVPHCSHNRHAS